MKKIMFFHELIMKKIMFFHEKEMRVKAQGNELMQYMNVSLSGLRGHYHPLSITSHHNKRS